MKQSPLSTQHDTEAPASPEHVLWLAVIDKAINDYLKWQEELNSKEKADLEWFLFSVSNQPFNLTYLCEQLFCDSTMAITIRKRISGIQNKEIPTEELEFYHRRRYSLRARPRIF